MAVEKGSSQIASNSGANNSNLGHWDCSKRDAAIALAQTRYDIYNSNYNAINQFSSAINAEKSRVNEIISNYYLIYALLCSKCEQILNLKNTAALNMGISNLKSYNSTLDSIKSEVNRSSRKCYTALTEASEALSEAKAMKCDWIPGGD